MRASKKTFFLRNFWQIFRIFGIFGVVVVVVVVEDFGSWVSPPSLNCSLAPCPSTLTRLALWAELFQQKIQSTVAKADRREPTVWLLRVLLQLAVKEGTISYGILFCTLYLLYKAV